MNTPEPIVLSAEEASPTALTFDGDGRPVIAAVGTPTPAPSAPEIAASSEPPAWAAELVTAAASGIGDAVAAALVAGPAPAPPAVTTVQVQAEAMDYLRTGARHSFVRDAFASRQGDADAQGRLVRFGAMVEDGALHAGTPWANSEVGRTIAAANEGTTTGQPSLIPPGYRPDLYVDQVQFPRPLASSVAQAPISDATPFQVPRFVSATGMTADHAAELTNPATGTIVSELVQVTPKAVSGIYDASRELVDSSAGGVAIDTIALAAMRESWSQQIEQRVHAALFAAGDGTDVPMGATPTAVAALLHIQQEIIALANRRKSRATSSFADASLYSVMATDRDAQGNPLLPWSAYSTVNVAGRTEAVLGANVMGTPLDLAWALTLQAVILERSSVYNFESPATTFRYDEQKGPSTVVLALWGYQAAKVLRPAGVTRLTYTGIPTGLGGSLAAETKAAK